MITTIILSKDRPAQLDLLLRSLKRNGGGQFDVHTIGIGVERQEVQPFERIYDGFDLRWRMVDPVTFRGGVEWLLEQATEFVCFMCDDGILYRPVVEDPTLILHDSLNVPTFSDFDQVLCFSLRYGNNTTVSYPSGLEQPLPTSRPWRWHDQPEGSDFGYPGSIDAHIFRTADVQRMLEGKSFPNPTALEIALMDGCLALADERPLMACYPHSVYVGNPVNRVSQQSNVRYGTVYPVTAEECNRRFLAGERIDLDAMNFSGVNAAHTEIELKWTSRA